MTFLSGSQRLHISAAAGANGSGQLGTAAGGPGGWPALLLGPPAIQYLSPSAPDALISCQPQKFSARAEGEDGREVGREEVWRRRGGSTGIRGERNLN